MTANNQQYALITGATSGIGYELAKLFAQNGFNIIAVARTGSGLQKVATEFAQFGVNVETIAKDLFEETEADELYKMKKQSEPADKNKK